MPPTEPIVSGDSKLAAVAARAYSEFDLTFSVHDGPGDLIVVIDNMYYAGSNKIRRIFEAILHAHGLKYSAGYAGNETTPRYTVAWGIHGGSPDLLEHLWVLYWMNIRSGAFDDDDEPGDFMRARLLWQHDAVRGLGGQWRGG